MTSEPETIDDPEKNFREQLVRLRHRREWSQHELAVRLKEEGQAQFYQQTVQRIEQGVRPVRLAEAEAIARVFGVSLASMTHPSGVDVETDTQWSLQQYGQEARRLLWTVGSASERWQQATAQLLKTTPGHQEGKRFQWKAEQGAILGASTAAEHARQMLLVLRASADAPKTLADEEVGLDKTRERWFFAWKNLEQATDDRRAKT